MTPSPVVAPSRRAPWHHRQAWVKALRPFSFSIAVVSCLLGAELAWLDGRGHALRALVVVVAGVLLQAGVNLVNDFHEFKQGRVDDKIPELGVYGAERSALEWRIFAAGMACFALVVPLGLWLVAESGRALLWLGVLGMLGAYFYTGEPFNYKRRGLAVLLVFFLMGVLMIAGAHLAVAGAWSAAAAWRAVPVSALVSLLLLSNELRDAEDDARHGIRTLTVRVGYDRAVALYWALVAVAFGGAAALWAAGLLPAPLLLVLAVPSLRDAARHLRAAPGARRALTPLTARFHLHFGALYLATLAWPALAARLPLPR